MDLYSQMDTSSMAEQPYFNYNSEKYKEARDFLIKCNLTQYLPVLIAEGFETMNAINEITEEDLAAMGVKRGHRRVIQREIATRKGIPKNQPLSMLVLNQASGINFNSDWKNPTNGNASSGSSSGAYTSGYGSMSSSMPPTTPNNYNTMIKQQDNNGNDLSVNMINSNNKETRSSSFSSNEEDIINDEEDDDDDEEDDDVSSTTTPLKRKYRRHPKRDKHAPIKPPSAYIMFSNDARAQLKDQNLSFVEIAKYVGDSWKKLDPVQKQNYERTAMREKDKYIERLNQYRKTAEYKRYQDYLSDFKSKQDALNRKIARSRKKAKLSGNSNTNNENDNESNGCSNTRSGSNSADSFNDPDTGSLTTTGEGAASSSSSGSSDIYKVHREKLKNSRKSGLPSSENNSNNNGSNGSNGSNTTSSLEPSDSISNTYSSNYQSCSSSGNNANSSNNGSSSNSSSNNNNNETESCYSPQQKAPPPMSDAMVKNNYHRLPFSDNSVSSIPILPPVKERKDDDERDSPLPKHRRSARFH